MEVVLVVFAVSLFGGMTAAVIMGWFFKLFIEGFMNELFDQWERDHPC